jgi:hypothetical protein
MTERHRQHASGSELNRASQCAQKLDLLHSEEAIPPLSAAAVARARRVLQARLFKVLLGRAEVLGRLGRSHRLFIRAQRELTATLVAIRVESCAAVLDVVPAHRTQAAL